MRLTRRDFMRMTGAGMTSLALPVGMRAPGQDAKRRPPNIVLILADDLGYAELGVQGCQDVPTPHVDSLAADGVRFTHGYVSCPVCSPTRAGLLTGRYQQRFGHEFNPGPPDEAPETFGLPLSEKTVADRLKSLGYATGLVGKWHQGYEPQFHPQRRGFDEFFGFPGGSHAYVGGDARSKEGRNPILRGTDPVEETEYLTDAFSREAVSFISGHADHPFFLYLAFNAVHSPLQAPDKYLSRFTKIEDPKRRTFAAMLSAMDDAVGAVLAELRSRGLDQDTLVFFLSDNGGPTASTTSSNGPLRGFKGMVLEGGIRVPFLARWTGKIPAGRVSHEPVISLDLCPTAAAAAGGSQDTLLDGVNLLPFLSGQSQAAPHDALYWRFGPQWAIRRGSMKLVNLESEPTKLYDLAKDIGEAQDLSSAKPEAVQDLKASWDSWQTGLVPPLWERNAQRKKGKRAKKA